MAMETDYEKAARERVEWLATLKVGDEVAYQTGFGGQDWVVAKITEINPRKNARRQKYAIAGTWYNVFGHMDTKYAIRRIEPVTDKVLEDIKRRNLMYKLTHGISTKGLKHVDTPALETMWTLYLNGKKGIE
jgi:hypothetical protein